MEYIKFNIDEHQQARVFFTYKEVKNGQKSQTVQRSFTIDKISEKEPKILEMIAGEIIGIYYEQRGSMEVTEVQYLDRVESMSEEDKQYAIDLTKKVCIDLIYDDLLKPPTIDEQVEDFIKEFFEDEDSEPVKQEDFLSKFFEEVQEEDTISSPKKDVVAEHFDKNLEEEPLKEKDFLSEFFAELEAEEPPK